MDSDVMVVALICFIAFPSLFLGLEIIFRFLYGPGAIRRPAHFDTPREAEFISFRTWADAAFSGGHNNPFIDDITSPFGEDINPATGFPALGDSHVCGNPYK